VFDVTIDFAVITATGKDKPGLIAEITDTIARANVNIVDIEAFSMRGLFAIFMIVDCRAAVIPVEALKDQIVGIGSKIGLDLTMEPYVAGRRKGEKKLPSNFEDFRSGFEDACGEVGQDVVVQTEDIFQRPKRLIVFDVDSTLIDVEVIDELAKAAGVGEKVREITRKAMSGEIDFKQALRERARLLKDLRVEVLKAIAENLEITPGAEELISTLKALGFKVALVSGGFKYFVERIRKKLGIDYAYANNLVIREGKLTGEVEEPIIDDERKGEIIRQLARKENLLLEEIVAVGDGANDRFMLQSSGLGIALNSKDILKKVADGVITKESLTGILYCLGAPEKRLREVFSKNSDKEVT
jgi:phosphoserine phosphatase